VIGFLIQEEMGQAFLIKFNKSKKLFTSYNLSLKRKGRQKKGQETGKSVGERTV
jgi:hypothetical protein